MRTVIQILVHPDDPIDDRVDWVELRLDLYPGLDVHAFIDACDKPVLATVRRARDGGAFDGSEADRLALLEGLPFVDLETDAQPEWTPERCIRSVHDLQGLPTEASVAADKVVGMPRDVVEAFELLGKGIALGDHGVFTRVLAPLTYCALGPVAPGVPTPSDLFDTYRVDRLGPSPALYGVAGSPIAHSRSPAIHNAGFARDGLDAVYLPFLVEDLATFWPVFLEHGGAGLSVTAPLKVQAAQLAAEPAPEVERCGAANTLLPDGRAFNTDYLAVLELVPAPVSDRSALVMGAGGAARAAVAALDELGYRTRVWARHRRGLEADFVDTPEPGAVVVNTTPLDPPAAPFVLDLRYGPGLEAGVAFLHAQARHQYRLFTGNEL
jgi:3-dehydroquinate dehydratase/shikimate dehydrogenase